MSARLPTVCFFQAYNRDYGRTETLLEGLRANGVPVVTCQVNRPGPLRYPLAILAFLRSVGRCDVVFANFRSFEILWLLRLLTRKPIVHDAHISFWQSACEERGWFRPDSLAGRLLFFMDRLNGRLAEHSLIESRTQRDFFIRTFGISPERITAVYVSCEERLFQPRPPAPRSAAAATVFWSGTGLPLQGLDVIYEAFQLLQARGVPGRLAPRRRQPPHRAPAAPGRRPRGWSTSASWVRSRAARWSRRSPRRTSASAGTTRPSPRRRS